MTIQYKRNHGAYLIGMSAAVAFVISLYNFFVLTSAIRHTGGAELAIASTLTILLMSACILVFRRLHAKWERAILYSILLLFILGSIFAAYLLETWTILGLLVISLVGWWIQVLTK